MSTLSKLLPPQHSQRGDSVPFPSLSLYSLTKMQEGESKATAIASERGPKIRIWLCVRISCWNLEGEKEFGWKGNCVWVTCSGGNFSYVNSRDHTTWAHVRGRYWSAKIDDISLWPPGTVHKNQDHFVQDLPSCNTNAIWQALMILLPSVAVLVRRHQRLKVTHNTVVFISHFIFYHSDKSYSLFLHLSSEWSTTLRLREMLSAPNTYVNDSKVCEKA